MPDDNPPLAMSTELAKHWFAIRVRLFHELKTRENLGKMGIECFVPVRSELRIWHDRRIIKDRVLTPQLIFIHATEKERIEVLKLGSVLYTICTPGKSLPARIPDVQMQTFIFFVTNANREVCFTEEPLREGDHVRIIAGALEGLEGIIAYNKGKHYFAVKVDLLGCAIMEIENDMIEKIADS
jgi:transcription antitermination factor NusG